MTKEAEILAAMMPFVPAFPNSRELPEETLAIYGRALSTLTPAEVSAAMVKLVRTVKFFPTIAEILDAAKEVTQHAAGTEKPSPAEAWDMAMTCVRRIGIYGKWDLPDEVATAVKYFGKEELCMLEMNAVNTARSQFMKMYQSIVERKAQKKENEDVLQVLGESRVQKLIRGIGSIKQIERKKVNKNDVVSP